MLRTILDQDIKAFLDEKFIVKDNESKRERQDIVASTDFEEFANASLFGSCQLPTLEQGRSRYPAPRFGACEDQNNVADLDPKRDKMVLLTKACSCSLSSGL